MHAASASVGTEPELRARERARDGQALAVGAPGVEVRRERDRRASVDERAGRRHRSPEEERGDREQHTDDVTRCEGGDAR